MGRAHRTIALALALGASATVGGQDPIAAAREAIFLEEWEKALAHLEKLPRHVPPRWDVERLFLKTEHALGRMERVMSRGAPYVQANPRDTEAHIWFGAALLALAQEPGLTAERATGFAEQALQCAEAVIKEGRDFQAIELCARTLIFLGRAGEAVSLGREAVEAEPERVESHRILAAALEGSGDPGEACRALEAAEPRFPGDGWPAVERGLVQERAGERKEALAAFTRALSAPRLSPEYVRTAAERIFTLGVARKDWKAAHALTDAWVEAHPQEALGSWWKGFVHEREGRPDLAEGFFQRAWDTSLGRLGEAALHLGHHSLARKDLPAAVERFGEALRLGAVARDGVRPAAEAMAGIAAQHLKAGKPDVAEAVLRDHGLKHVPEQPLLLEQLGIVLRSRGDAAAARADHAKARAVWREAAEVMTGAGVSAIKAGVAPPTVARIHLALGLLQYERLNAIEPARRALLAAHEALPEALEVQEALGRIALKERAWDEARTWFDRVLATAPGRPASVEGRARAVAGAEAEARKKGGGKDG